MARHDSQLVNEITAQHALRVLEVFSASAQITFDRILAGRVLGEAQSAIDGDDSNAWSRRLVEVGESLGLRIRTFEGSLHEAFAFIRQGVPVAFCSDQTDGEVRWLVLSETRGRKVRLASLDPVEDDTWVSFRKLKRMRGLGSSGTSARWIIGQPAMGCEPAGRLASHRSDEKTLTPFARLVGLMRPEKNDLWVVLTFSIVVGVLALATPVAVEALVNTVAFGRYLQPVIILALLLFTFLAFAATIRGLLAFVVEIVQRRLFIRVVEDLAYRLPRVRQEQFDDCHGPELANRFFDIVTVQKTAASLLLDGISIVLQAGIGMAVLAFYHPFLLGFDVVLLGLLTFIVFGLGRGAVKTAIKESKAKYAIAAWLEELTRHATAFKLNSGNQFALERADQLAVHWLDMRRNHFRIVIRQILFALGMQAAAATALLGLGGWLVILGELTLGQLVAAELIVMVIVGSFAKMGKHLESFYDLLASVDKLGALFDLDTESHDKLFHLRENAPARVAFRDVSYAYGGNSAIKDLTLNIEPGESVAVIGCGGAGKSTIIDMLAGLRSPKSGHIELDDIDIRELRPDSLREHMSVARNVEIFHGKISENVHLNRPNIRANDVRDALETVGLLEELLELPDGLNTMLQTHGAPLSTSQANRLMLARAIIGRPRLLLIDGTLDCLADDALNQVIAGLTGKGTPWTLVVTTGKQSIADKLDRTVRLHDGSIRREGGQKLLV